MDMIQTWRRGGQQIEVTFSFFGFLKKTTNSTPLILSHIKRFHLKFRLHLNRKERRKEVEEARLWGHLLTGKITLKYFSISSLLKIMGVGTHQRGMAQIFVTVRLTRAKKESMSRKMSLGTSVLVGKASRCPHVPSSCFSNHSWKFKVLLCIVTYQAILAMLDEI